MQSDILHKDFKAMPYWWEAYRPVTGDLVDVPKTTRVAIVGGGYAGLSCAIELADSGFEACVLEAAELGAGASTRSGGAVSGGVNIGKSFTGKVISREPEETQEHPRLRQRRLQPDRKPDRAREDRLLTGRRPAASSAPGHRRITATRRTASPRSTPTPASGSYMVPKERQREEMASDYYYGGMVVERSAKLHPALYYKGLLDAARKRPIAICAKAAVKTIKPAGAGWRIETSRGTIEAGDVVIATNGYTGDATPELMRRLIPLASHIIATEELPEDLARSLIPKGRTLSDTKRVLCYYRMSPDGRRMVFGGRARFTQVTPDVSAPVLYRFMTDRFPQLKGSKVTHAWTGNVAFTFDALPHTGVLDGMHYALGCNGSGVAVMTYLGRETARRIVGGSNATCGFELEEFPDFPMYNGKPDWALPAIGRLVSLSRRLRSNAGALRLGGFKAARYVRFELAIARGRRHPAPNNDSKKLGQSNSLPGGLHVGPQRRCLSIDPDPSQERETRGAGSHPGRRGLADHRPHPVASLPTRGARSRRCRRSTAASIAAACSARPA